MLMKIYNQSMADRVTTDHLTTYFLSLTLGKRRAARGPRASDGPGGPVNRRQRRDCGLGNTLDTRSAKSLKRLPGAF